MNCNTTHYRANSSSVPGDPTLPALTDAVARLSVQLTELIGLAAPLEAAEREVSAIGHLFHRRGRRGAAGADDPQP